MGNQSRNSLSLTVPSVSDIELTQGNDFRRVSRTLRRYPQYGLPGTGGGTRKKGTVVDAVNAADKLLRGSAGCGRKTPLTGFRRLDAMSITQTQ